MDINFSKYIELLRFYVTDKIGQLNHSVQNTLGNEMDEVLSSILSAFFSFFISSEFVKISGILGTTLRLSIVIVLYFVLKFLIRKTRRYIKSTKEEKEADESRLSRAEVKSLIDRFDHIACDGILLSRDYHKKYLETEKEKTNEKLYYLFEAFYYFKKALQITELVTKYPEDCFNNQNQLSGISMYRFSNLFLSLSELQDALLQSITTEKSMAYHNELMDETIETEKTLKKINKYMESISAEYETI